MRRLIARIHRVLAGLYTLLIVTQFYFAGMALFGAESWSWHIGLGWSLWDVTSILLIVALVGWLGRRTIGLSLLVLALTTLQVFLPSFQGSEPFVAAYHPVNAMVLLVLGYLMVRRPSRLVTAAPKQLLR